MGRVVHFEIPASDPEHITGFYSKVFGWKIEKWGHEDYWLATTGESDVHGINGAIMKRRDLEQPLVININVDDIDKTIEDIEANGGQVIVSKLSIPKMGWSAYFKDPDGVVMGLYQEDPVAE